MFDNIGQITMVACEGCDEQINRYADATRLTYIRTGFHVLCPPCHEDFKAHKSNKADN